MGLIPGLGRSLGGVHGNPLQYSSLENPIDRGRRLAGYSAWGHTEPDCSDLAPKHPWSELQEGQVSIQASFESQEGNELSWPHSW